MATAVALGILISRHGAAMNQALLMAWYRNPDAPEVRAVFANARHEMLKRDVKHAGKSIREFDKQATQTLDDLQRDIKKTR